MNLKTIPLILAGIIDFILLMQVTSGQAGSGVQLLWRILFAAALTAGGAYLLLRKSKQSPKPPDSHEGEHLAH